MDKLILLTNNEYDRSKYRSAGVVTTTHVEAVSGLRALAADIVGVFGNKSELLTKKTNDALAAVNTALVVKARENYSNLAGLCDIKYSNNAFSNEENRTFIVFQVAATALVPSSAPVTGGGKTRRRPRRNYA